MNQYILILIWILIMGIFYGTRRTNDIENTGSDVISPPSILFCVCLVVPLVFSAAFRTTFGDQGYKIAFRAASVSFSDLVSTIQSGAKGPGYYVIQYIGGLLFGNDAEVFFFVIASLQMISLVRLYRKYSSDLWIGMFIFVASTDYLSWMQEQEAYDGTKEDLKRVIEYYQKDEHQAELEQIAKTGCEYVRMNFNGDAVAKNLLDQLETQQKIWLEQRGK